MAEQRKVLDSYEPGEEIGDDDYVPGCGEYDTRDSKGEKLRPYYNDAREPYWM